MKKLIILKSIVDFIWIVTCIPLIPLLLFFSVFMFFNDELFFSWFKFEAIESQTLNISIKLFILLLIVFLFIVVYCFYLFRKTLRYFQKRKPFDFYVIDTYKRIGNLLCISGIAFSLLFFVFNLIYKSKLEIHLGISPYLFIICLGLFFMILSETFKIAKQAKEDNELTI